MVTICRLCGISSNESQTVGIFSRKGVSGSLAYKIKFTLDITVLEYDPLPKKVCKPCLAKLFDTYTFQESCRKTQIDLRERFLAKKGWDPKPSTSTPGEQQLPTHSDASTTLEPDVNAAEKQDEITLSSILSSGNDFPGNTQLSEKNNPTTSLVPTCKPETVENVSSQTDISPAQPQLTVFGQPFQFSTFVRNGMLDEIVKVISEKNLSNSNSKNTKGLKEQQRKKSSSEQDEDPISSDCASVIEKIATNQSVQLSVTASSSNGAAPETSVATTVSSPMQKEDSFLNSNCVGNSSMIPAFTTLPFTSATPPGQGDNIKIVEVFSVKDNSDLASSVSSPTTTTNSTSCHPYLTERQGIPLSNTNVMGFMPSTITTPTYISQAPIPSTLPTQFLITAPTTGSWHSVPNNMLHPISPLHLQNVSNMTPVRNWHTPSQNMPECTVQTSTPTEKSNNSLDEANGESSLTSTVSANTNPTKNWHTPSQRMPESPVETSVENSSDSSRKKRNLSPLSAETRSKWHTPSKRSNMDACSSAVNSDSMSKKADNQLSSSSTASSSCLPEDEDDDDDDDDDDIRVVEVVKANRESLAQFWEKCDTLYKCKKCSRIFKKLTKCEIHIQTHLGIKPFECNVCKRKFVKKRLLNEHAMEHLGKKLYQCKECPKSFRYRKNFRLHLQTHTELVSRSYMCELCRRTFKSQYDYYYHKTSKHILAHPTAVVLE